MTKRDIHGYLNSASETNDVYSFNDVIDSLVFFDFCMKHYKIIWKRNKRYRRTISNKYTLKIVTLKSIQ